MRIFIKLAVLFFGVGFSLEACSREGTPVRPHVPTVFSPQTRTVLSGDNAMALAHPCSRPAPGPVSAQWTPSADDLEQLEEPLQSMLIGQLVISGSTAAPADYYRQYAGFIIGGRRVIYANGVNRSVINDDANAAPPIDWRTQAISVCDGGPVSFGAEYDADTRQLSKFAFNGRP
jgi:hypothetical protein